MSLPFVGQAQNNNRWRWAKHSQQTRLKITYKSSADDKGAQYFPAASGNKIIKLTFEIENISSTDQIVSVYDFKCYSDDVASSAYYYGDNGLSTTTLSSGRKATGNVYFEVPQNANSIDS